jgi:hypothetical protein
MIYKYNEPIYNHWGTILCFCLGTECTSSVDSEPQRYMSARLVLREMKHNFLEESFITTSCIVKVGVHLAKPTEPSIHISLKSGNRASTLHRTFKFITRNSSFFLGLKLWSVFWVFSWKTDYYFYFLILTKFPVQCWIEFVKISICDVFILRKL